MSRGEMLAMVCPAPDEARENAVDARLRNWARVYGGRVVRLDASMVHLVPDYDGEPEGVTADADRVERGMLKLRRRRPRLEDITMGLRHARARRADQRQGD